MEMENEKRRSPRHLRHPHTGRRRDGPCRGACDTWERRRTSVDPQMDTLDLVGSMFLLEPGWARTAWTRIALRRRAAPPRRRTNERVNDFFFIMNRMGCGWGVRLGTVALSPDAHRRTGSQSKREPIRA